MTIKDRLARAVLNVGKTTQLRLRQHLAIPDQVLPSTPRDTWPIAVYFSDPPELNYQLSQWLPVLVELQKRHPVVLVFRNYEVFTKYRTDTRFEVAFARQLDDLIRLYERLDVNVVLYPNNGFKNFQSLAYQRALHVHINHGESDKLSMVSNQAKGYDHVVVAGKAAVDRHRRALIAFDPNHLIQVGRPQLDLAVEPAFEALPGVKTILYAPTFSGEAESNNYTSIARYGESIAKAVLAMPGVRLVYKPHPRVVTGDRDEAVNVAHRAILALIETANKKPGDILHLTPLKGDVLAMFPNSDMLVSDISSVGLDYLYSQRSRPIVLTDRRDDRAHLIAESPLAGHIDVIDSSTESIRSLIAANLDDDPRHDERVGVADYYFGFGPGESTERFFEFIASEISLRERLVKELRAFDAG